ncbi:MAG: hypothetical protein JXB13_03320 [Phycisphaerae bacterium]|nr:hypothetical protein [Phycisphaerae bacterium]
MRPPARVSAREKGIGGLVLLVAAAIVVACGVVTIRESTPLFEIAPGNEKVSPNRELLVAQRMMPALGTAGWSDARAIQVDPSDVPDAPPAARDVDRVFTGRYENLADVAQQVRVTIYDAGTPENALGLFTESRPAESESLAVGCGGWRTQTGGGFWAGRYCTRFDRSTVTETDPTIQTIADALAGVQLRYGPAPAEPSLTEAKEDSLLPAIDLAGWGEAMGLRVYTPEDLWEKIDGRADLYLAFHMVRMVFGTYSDSRDPGNYIDVYWYDMGTPDNAFGIYRAEMSSEPRSVDVGREGYATPGGVFFWKGGSYVRVEASDGSQELADVALAAARAVAQVVPDADRRLWADDLLPEENRVAGSFGYEATDAFSLGFLDDVFRAEYQAGDATYTTFVHRAKDEVAARATFDAYAAFFQEHGQLFKRQTREGFDLVVGEVGGVVDAVVVVKNYLGGVSGTGDAALAEEKVVAFAQTLVSEAN